MSTSSQTHEHRVAGGYKATISNPNTSEEAKEHARLKLAEMGAEYEDEPQMQYREEEHRGEHHDSAHHSRVMAGYKATISNPNNSEEAKEHARRMLAEMSEEHNRGSRTTRRHEDEVHQNRVLSGYQATSKNPNVSTEVKEHAEAVLSGQETYDERNPSAEEKHAHRVQAGYKATLSNPNTSEEAKQHAREVLAEGGIET